MNEREVARELLRELLDGALAHRSGNGNGDGHAAADAPPPQVPAPPVAEVLRPASWQAPAPSGGTERVRIASDADLERFVRALADRFADPGQRAAAKAGRLRFTLDAARGHGEGPRGRGGGSGGDGAIHVDRGAVTERTVARAAKDGARLVLGPRAVLTPLAREKARAAGVEIERERTC